MDKRKKRFCPRGHDTLVVGRTKERRCRTCNTEKCGAWNKAHPEAHRAASLKWFNANREHDINRRLVWKYGITLAQKTEMFQRQSGKCATCPFVFESVSSAHVDHCHTTGKVRGLLCSSCNLVAGKAKDSPATLRSIADYLEQTV
jgi:hypothetical protein